MLVQGLSEGRSEAQDFRLTADGALNVLPVGSGKIVYEGQAAWPNNASVNTIVNLDIPSPCKLQGEAIYLLTITNPSSVSALTVSVRNKESFGGTARYPELAKYGIAAGLWDGRSVLMQGWLLGEGGRLSISNDSLLGSSDGFDANVRIRMI